MVYVGHDDMTARPSEEVAATGGESSEPVLGLHGECTHSLTVPALTMIDSIGHASLCEGANGYLTPTPSTRIILETSCFPSYKHSKILIRLSARLYLLSEVLHR
jgi:hypothetical protein